MKIPSHEFNLRELAGSMGDFGTLFPLAIGYMVVCGLNPTGLLVTMGLANIATGLLYRLPMPIEPMKLLAVVAIAQRWTPSMVYASGFAMGVVWLVFAGTGIIGWIGKITPRSVIRGIQASLGLLLAGFAQIPLTATNAVMATSSLMKSYWPEKTVTERQLSLNMGIMNLILPFFGGMPLCHGAGGLAGQYYFGARTGGTNILEGLIEISMGLFLPGSIAGLLGFFPTAIIGAMMFLVGIELTKFATNIRLNKDLIPMGVTLVVSLAMNMDYGFLAGLLLYHVIRLIFRKKGYCKCHGKAVDSA